MEIIKTQTTDRLRWNNFVKDNYPPVGAFMQTWEWGEFKKNLGVKVERYFIRHKSEVIAAFTLVEQKLPLKFTYGYLPRGPVIHKSHQSATELASILKNIRTWVIKNYPNFLFLRLEPPIMTFKVDVWQKDFYKPGYYVQPRYNEIIQLDKEEEEILANFHPSTRSNIKRAEKRAVTSQVVDFPVDKIHDDFCLMTNDIVERNHGQHIYPGKDYFTNFLKTIPMTSAETKKDELSLITLYGYCGDEPAAIYLALLFGETMTYLYGASLTAHLNSKVTTYLHWQAMREAKRRGHKYYDLGAVDEKLWPTLTQFKRQFKGQEFTYVGNIDIPLNPLLYQIYNLAQWFKRLRA